MNTTTDNAPPESSGADVQSTGTQRTNVEMLIDLMEYSPQGALMQAFVLTAIEEYAKQCINAGATAFDSAGLSGRAWVACAQNVKAALAAPLQTRGPYDHR